MQLNGMHIVWLAFFTLRVLLEMSLTPPKDASEAQAKENVPAMGATAPQAEAGS
jgi:hypothetical protein